LVLSAGEEPLDFVDFSVCNGLAPLHHSGFMSSWRLPWNFSKPGRRPPLPDPPPRTPMHTGRAYPVEHNARSRHAAAPRFQSIDQCWVCVWSVIPERILFGKVFGGHYLPNRAVVLNRGYTYPLGVRSTKIFRDTRPEIF